ncbi:FAD-binding oxidoreductase [Azospirillum argentinense]
MSDPVLSAPAAARQAAAGTGDSWPVAPEAATPLVSFDGGVQAAASVQRPDRYGFFRCAGAPRPAIARGSGLSYTAASFGNGATSVDLSRFDRVLDFDSNSGVVEVEPGITLLALHRFLSARGFYLPVQPGHGRISVGGCIGADVHGKNHARDGTFLSQVEGLRLFHPRHGIVELTPDREPDLFRATCGGYGLTGIVVGARLRTKRLTGSGALRTVHPVNGPGDAATLLNELAWTHDGVYSWHDCANPGSGFGRGHVVAIRFTEDGAEGAAAGAEASAAAKAAPLSSEWRRLLPVGVLTPWTSRLMAVVYNGLQRRPPDTRRASVEQCLFPLHGSEAYFRLFGRAGFHEHQVIVPADRFTDYIEGVRDAAAGTPIALASGKLFAGDSDLLRFSGSGICFAVNLPRRPGSAEVMGRLDRLMLELGGRPNIIKDSRLPRAVVEAAYPDCDRFRSILRDWDPGRLFRSELSERLGL